MRTDSIKFTIFNHVLVWLLAFVRLLDSLIVIISLGFIYPDWDLWAEGKYLDIVEDIQRSDHRGKAQ